MTSCGWLSIHPLHFIRLKRLFISALFLQTETIPSLLYCSRLRWMGWESTNVERDAHVIKAKRMQYLIVSTLTQVSIHLIPKLPLHNLPPCWHRFVTAMANALFQNDVVSYFNIWTFGVVTGAWWIFPVCTEDSSIGPMALSSAVDPLKLENPAKSVH